MTENKSTITKPTSSALDMDAEMARRIIVRFLRDGLHRHGFTRGVVGLSGGLDSALVVFLAAQALGPENVLAVAMPYSASSPLSLAGAQEVAAATGVRLETVPIHAMAEPYLMGIPQEEQVRRGNVLARLRMVVLFDLSARENALVVGTSNKTELLLGYTTQFGDSACALLPIGDLYKMQVRQLARHVGVPESILERPPSADLWAGQTDEEEMGFTYEEVDRLFMRMIDERIPPARLVEEGFDSDLIHRVRTLVRRSQYKRLTPPVAKISHRTVGSDFRYPRDWDSWDSE
jgi:NAD+ synthase